MCRRNFLKNPTSNQRLGSITGKFLPLNSFRSDTIIIKIELLVVGMTAHVFSSPLDNFHCLNFLQACRKTNIFRIHQFIIILYGMRFFLFISLDLGIGVEVKSNFCSSVFESRIKRIETGREGLLNIIPSTQCLSQ